MNDADERASIYQTLVRDQEVRATKDLVEMLREVRSGLASIPEIKAAIDGLVVEVHGRGKHIGLREQIASLRTDRARATAVALGCLVALVALSAYSVFRAG